MKCDSFFLFLSHPKIVIKKTHCYGRECDYVKRSQCDSRMSIKLEIVIEK
jgi:hypothetical protein